ncbi:cellulose biosynthesis protein BcsQ [Shewanella surugensis]|uniref:Cellulose synthase operon protein YhjQ n=1 Tax=Shewanella surugensis TaxID=212020 RepID=A0ABT0L7H4_9GAMM|nr:cellulose biosynthesis protein BcsQ [Shewanella surugensis]MCL1123638.1 cellulose synthase operon protein YhjQ [Shewanella surugensis]
MMKRMIIAGLKGGEGATTVTANLANALERLNQQTLSVDCTKMNLLRLHFSTPIQNTQGWAVNVMNNTAFYKAAYESPEGVAFFPFGELTVEETNQFKTSKKNVFNTLTNELTPLGGNDCWQLVLLDDFIENKEIYLSLLDSSDIICLVLTPDPSHYNLLHNKVFSRESFFYQKEYRIKTKFLVNQFHPEAVVSCDFLMVLQQELHDYLLPVILHYDVAIVESLANLTSLSIYAPQSQSSHDFQALAYWCLSYFSPENHPSSSL